MIKFSDLFSFTRNEVRFSFNNAKKKASIPGLILLQAPLQETLPEPFGKLLIVIPRLSGKAHKRNLFRRRVKSIFYEEKLFEKPVTSILLVRKTAIDLPFDQLKEFLVKNI